MIVVTGTKRSGTSMWMQILEAAGFAVIGDRFPGRWGELIREANPRGFYECLLSSGVYFRTNPHPQTGAFLFPEQVREHGVKIFAPGLVRTELGYLDRVIVTVRPWREYVASMNALRALNPTSEDGQAGEFIGLDRSRQGLEPLHPALEWWADNFMLIRDVATRRYPVHFQTYPSLLADPARVLERTLEWIGGGDLQSAVAAVDPSLHRACRPKPTIEAEESMPRGVPAEHVRTFDAIYEAIHDTGTLDPSLIQRANATNEALLPHFLEQQATLRERALGVDLEAGRAAESR